MFCRFVHVEGLREFLFHQNSSAPIVTGEKVKEGSNVYIAGGGGYVFTREYLTRFVDMIRDNRTDNVVGCKRSEFTAVEDVYISNFNYHTIKWSNLIFATVTCMRLKQVIIADSRDLSGMNRFSQHPGAMRESKWNVDNNWYWFYQYYQSTLIVSCHNFYF